MDNCKHSFKIDGFCELESIHIKKQTIYDIYKCTKCECIKLIKEEKSKMINYDDYTIWKVFNGKCGSKDHEYFCDKCKKYFKEDELEFKKDKVIHLKCGNESKA